MSEVPGIEPEKREGDDPADAAVVTLEFMSLEVWDSEYDSNDYDNISGWSIDQFGHLHVRRRDMDVAVYPSGQWRNMKVRYKFTDGSWIDADNEGGPTESVAVGVTVNAIGGRSS